MTKQQAAAELVSFYRWSKYHDMAMQSDVMVLGWRCGLDVVSTENEEMIMSAMRRI